MKNMWNFINDVLTTIDDFVWGVPLMVLILAGGLLLTARLGFLQIRKLPLALKWMVKNEDEGHGEISSFSALCTALSATIGTGNIVGVATAVGTGGPGALFWMVVTAFFGMATKYAEGLLAVKYRVVAPDGHSLGGPFYYIEQGMGKKWTWLAKLFAFFGVCVGLFGIGTFSQVNGIASAVKNFFDPDTAYAVTIPGIGTYSWTVVIASLVLSVCVALVLIGGIKRIANVSQVVVPFMAVIYVIFSVLLLICNVKQIPSAFVTIVKGAFNPQAVTGGIVGSMIVAMQNGIARGIFSNEAGLGTGSIAHACADTRKPVKQGFFGIFEVFTDTIVICTLTALVILCSGIPVSYGAAAGAELTILGFTSTYGSWVSVFTAVAMCCFAFSTIIGWGLYGARCCEFLFSSSRTTKPFMVLYSLVAILGATVDLGLLWNIAETFNGLMAIPNLIAVFLLSGVVVKLVKEYFTTGDGKDA